MERNSQITLFVIVVIGTILRFVTIAKDSLWFDEGATVVLSSKSIPEIFGLMFSGEFNPPIFYTLEHFIIQTIGVTTWSVRLIPAIAAVLSIPAIFYLGKELHSERLGLFAAALLAISPWHIAYAQEARAYTLAILLFICTLVYFIRLITRKDYIVDSIFTWKGLYYEVEHCYKSYDYKLAFVIFAILCIWTHFFTAIFIIPMLVVALFKKHFVVVATVVIACLPLLSAIIGLSSLYTESPDALRVAAENGLLGLDIIPTTLTYFGGFNQIAMYILAISIPIGAYVLYEKNKTSTILLVAMTIFSLLFVTYLSTRMLMEPRYISCLLPILMIFVAATAIFFDRFDKTNFVSLAVIVIVISVSIPNIMILFVMPQKAQWEGAAKFVSEQDIDNVVIISGHYSWHPFKIYYDNSSHNSTLYGATNIYELENITIGSTIYLVSPGEMIWMDNDSRIMTRLNSTATLINHDYEGVFIYES